MYWRTGTLRHGLRLGGLRISPPGMSIVPGVATPMAVTWEWRRPADETASRIVSAMRSRPNSCPRGASVGRLTAPRTRPPSSITPPFMLVPPTSSPAQINGAMCARGGMGEIAGARLAGAADIPCILWAPRKRCNGQGGKATGSGSWVFRPGGAAVNSQRRVQVLGRQQAVEGQRRDPGLDRQADQDGVAEDGADQAVAQVPQVLRPRLLGPVAPRQLPVDR